VRGDDLGVRTDPSYIYIYIYIYIYMVVYLLRLESLCDYEVGELGGK
jgi:hypothetical protein